MVQALLSVSCIDAHRQFSGVLRLLNKRRTQLAPLLLPPAGLC